MNRDSFIKMSLLAGTVMALPFVALANYIKALRDKTGFMVDAGKDRFEKTLVLFEGDTFYTKVSSKDSDGDVFVFESTRTKEGGPEHHYHFDQDEWWYVLKGEFLIKIGDRVFNAKAGDSVFGPRMVPHSFAKVGEGEGKLLMFFQPAGKMEEFFTKVSQGAAKDMSDAERDKFREAHGFKRVGPPIINAKKW